MEGGQGKYEPSLGRKSPLREAKGSKGPLWLGIMSLPFLSPSLPGARVSQAARPKHPRVSLWGALPIPIHVPTHTLE